MSKRNGPPPPPPGGDHGPQGSDVDITDSHDKNATDSFNGHNFALGLQDNSDQYSHNDSDNSSWSHNVDNHSVNPVDSYNGSSTHDNGSHNVYTDASTSNGVRQYNAGGDISLGAAGTAGIAAGGSGSLHAVSFSVDQSTNQNIEAAGSDGPPPLQFLGAPPPPHAGVDQQFNQQSAVAAGDGSAAGTGDATVYVDNSSVWADGNILSGTGAQLYDISIDDSFHETAHIDDSVHIDGSFDPTFDNYEDWNNVGNDFGPGPGDWHPEPPFPGGGGGYGPGPELSL